ncbi:MAG: hypothetical protein Q8Q62_17530 [Mesorhizobium sp.]|nr:hypothetical protein [Mesorhizobium sp.]
MPTAVSETQTRTLRPAAPKQAAAAPAPGPFGAVKAGRAADMRSALGLGLLVLYPVFASVVVVVAGVVLGGSALGA